MEDIERLRNLIISDFDTKTVDTLHLKNKSKIAGAKAFELNEYISKFSSD